MKPMDGDSTRLMERALAAHAAGLCVLPPREDGSKAPIKPWGEYQRRRSTVEEITEWYARGCSGIGLVCGRISGELETLEFEGRAVAEGLWEDFKQAAEKIGLDWLLARIASGYGERTPSGGIHLIYRCPDGVGDNTVLARRPATPSELANDQAEEDAEAAMQGRKPIRLTAEKRARILIETRGEGGYLVVAPSAGGVHPTGRPYEVLAGGFESIAEISGEERQALLTLARSFDRMPRADWSSDRSSQRGEAVESEDPASERPGDDFNARADWARDVLEPAGWSLTGRDHEGRERWYRAPGGEGRGWTSATIAPDRRCLYVFSTSTELPVERGLSKFRAYAFLHHGGDFRQAAQELGTKGFGRLSVIAGRQEGEAAAPERSAERPWPEPPAEDAFYGLAGQIVAEMAPHTEADPAAVLVQLLTLFGCMVGTRPHLQVGAVSHHARLFAGVVGETSKARKGESWADAKMVAQQADADFKRRIRSGLASGEAVIHEVRDPVEEWDEETRSYTISRPGVEDKRLLVFESEMSRLLGSMQRDGNVVSAVLRDAWDGGDLMVTSKNTGERATGAHVALVSHITVDELRQKLPDVEMANGFANRILWVAARRSRLLPEPEAMSEETKERLATGFRVALEQAQTIGRMMRDDEARSLWYEVYPKLAAGRSGLAGAILARAEAQVLRLSLAYALFDASELIRLPHLKAGLALWDYCERSVDYIFGDAIGNPVADRILESLRTGPMSRTEVHHLFKRHVSAQQVGEAISMLLRLGRVRQVVDRSTGGRPMEYLSLAAAPERTEAAAAGGLNSLFSQPGGEREAAGLNSLNSLFSHPNDSGQPGTSGSSSCEKSEKSEKSPDNAGPTRCEKSELSEKSPGETCACEKGEERERANKNIYSNNNDINTIRDINDISPSWKISSDILSSDDIASSEGGDEW